MSYIFVILNVFLLYHFFTKQMATSLGPTLFCCYSLGFFAVAVFFYSLLRSHRQHCSGRFYLELNKNINTFNLIHSYKP